MIAPRVRGKTIVIAGATSGIGLATARLAARHGARLLLVARNADALARTAAELGENARWIAADVADDQQVRAIEAEAEKRFGGFDAWIHAAGVGLFAPVLATRERDHRRIFDVNLWGTLHCTRMAIDHLREKGGAIVVVSSVLGDRAMPWQGALAAAEHARKAWCDSLRMELRHDRIPVEITVLQPGGIDTPFARRAAAPPGLRPAVPPRLYHPDVVARAALRCVGGTRRDLVLGDTGPVLLEKLAPSLGDRLLAALVSRKLARMRPEPPTTGALYAPLPHERATRGTPPRRVLRHSLRAALAIHEGPALLAAAAVVATFAFARRT